MTQPAPPPAYRPAPPVFDSRLARAPMAPRPVAPAPPQLVAVPPQAPPRRSGRAGVVTLVVVLGVLFFALIAYFLTALGPIAPAIGMILALIPLAIVFFAVRLVDRWEPEPVWLVILALGWGAIIAVAIALGVDFAREFLFGPATTDVAIVMQAVFQAPIVEELAKGLGVYLIFVIGRRYFDGPVDGIVYAALVAGGFAFTENIQYFAVSLLEGGVVEAGFTFFYRGILSPFAHVMFTSMTGFALGLAARRGMSAGAALGPWIVGVAAAVVLHGFWNGSTIFGDFFLLYFVLQLPLFVLFIFGIVMLRREEARLTRQRLGDFAAAGWFTPGEVEMLATGAGRRRAMAWARTLPGSRAPVMRAFIKDATGLAAARQRALSGRDPGAPDDERMLLGRAVADRAALFA